MNINIDNLQPDKNTIKALDGITKDLKRTMDSFGRIEIPKIEIPLAYYEIQKAIESLPKPATIIEPLLSATKSLIEQFTRIDPGRHLVNNMVSAVTKTRIELVKKTNEAFAEIKKIFLIGEKLTQIGQFGWTTLPDTYYESYLDCPIDNHNMTDDYFMELLKDPIVDSLMSDISTLAEGIISDDVSEAINDYKEGKYKSCALIMFSLIDSILIRNHVERIMEQFKNSEKYKKLKRRPTGKLAAQNIMEYLKNNTPEFYRFYQFSELNSCLQKLFNTADDFSIPEHPINRNMLVHGMLNRKVEKKDCLQLFLLYRNFVKIILDYNKWCDSHKNTA